MRCAGDFRKQNTRYLIRPGPLVSGKNPGSTIILSINRNLKPASKRIDGRSGRHWLARGKDILLDIDVQGTEKILKRYLHAVTIFILPPSMDVLRHRLESRGTDSHAEIERRLSEAEKEMLEKSRYRHLVINDDLPSAIDELASIIKSYEKRNQ